MPIKHSLCIVVVALIIVNVFGFQSGDHQAVDPGKRLAEQYCSSCHQFPDPSILTKRSWQFLLTDMGFRLGIVDYDAIAATPAVAMMHMTTRENILREAGAIPSEPLISMDDWRAIREYYDLQAPAKPIAQAKKPAIRKSLKQFKLRLPAFQPRAAVFTLVRVNPYDGGLILNNIRDQSFTVLDTGLNITESHPESEILVDVAFNNGNLDLLAIGDLMGRFIGVGKGKVQSRKLPGYEDQGILVEGLHRPAGFQFADIDNSGTPEIIVCNFGDITGNVSVYKDGYMAKELINLPGAIKSQTHDFNDDGLVDIAVLLGDARENISIFYNQGENNFTRDIVVECHSAYGHTYFELQDFNGDGHMDLLAVNGDTDADPFNTLKNYHGIRIYMNDGKNKFTQEYFYPMYGAHFAKAADFDQDGDLDIAASSFFPDFSSAQPEQFVFLENQGRLKFNPYTHPETYQGRWMIMDIGDYDLDGDIDVVLGGGYLPLGMVVDYGDKYKSLMASGKALLVFENQLK